LLGSCQELARLGIARSVGVLIQFGKVAAADGKSYRQEADNRKGSENTVHSVKWLGGLFAIPGVQEAVF
jgi:hypothetical protein